MDVMDVMDVFFMLTITASVFVLTALALANMMVVGAMERRRLLGVLRSEGMTRRQLARLLVTENLAIGILSLSAQPCPEQPAAFGPYQQARWSCF